MYREVIVSLYRSIMANVAISALARVWKVLERENACDAEYDTWIVQTQHLDDDSSNCRMKITVPVTVPARYYLDICAGRRRANRRWAFCTGPEANK